MYKYIKYVKCVLILYVNVGNNVPTKDLGIYWNTENKINVCV